MRPEDEAFVEMTGGEAPAGFEFVVVDPENMEDVRLIVERLPPITDGPRLVAHGPQRSDNRDDGGEG